MENFPGCVSVKYSQLKYFPSNWSQAQDTWALNKACLELPNLRGFTPHLDFSFLKLGLPKPCQGRPKEKKADLLS